MWGQDSRVFLNNTEVYSLKFFVSSLSSRQSCRPHRRVRKECDQESFPAPTLQVNIVKFGKDVPTNRPRDLRLQTSEKNLYSFLFLTSLLRLPFTTPCRGETESPVFWDGPVSEDVEVTWRRECGEYHDSVPLRYPTLTTWVRSHWSYRLNFNLTKSPSHFTLIRSKTSVEICTRLNVV